MDCGVSFLGYPKSKRCPDCQRRIKRAREAAHKRNGAARPLGSIDRCQCCGAEYVVQGSLQKYCKACSDAAVSQNVRQNKRLYMQQHAEDFAPAKAANRTCNKICVVCGKVFDTDSQTVTCSPGCAAALKRVRQAQTDYRRGHRLTPPPDLMGVNIYKKEGNHND